MYDKSKVKVPSVVKQAYDRINADPYTSKTVEEQRIDDLKALVGKLGLDNGAVRSEHLALGSIGSVHIQQASISNAHIMYGAIQEAHIGNAVIKGVHIVNGTIENIHILDSTIDNAKIKNATITGAKIALATIDTANIKDASIDNAKIKDATITTAKIGLAQITNALITDAAITTAKIQDGSIVNAKILDGTIMNAKIGNAQITGAKIASATIETANIKDANITTAKIGLGQITTALIGDAQITTAKIGTGQITTALIGDAQISNAKIIDATISGAKIGSAQIGNAHIQDASISSAKISNGAIGTAHLGTAIVDTAHIKDASISSAKILDLVADKITSGTLSTTKITISGVGGFLRISGNRLQVFDNSPIQKERVSLGDVDNNGTLYGLRVRGADGTTVLYDHNGVYNAGITDGAITNPKIGDNAIDDRVIKADSVMAKHILAGTITGDKIAANTITASKIDVTTLQVGSANIIDASIGTSKIADASISNAKIQNLAVDGAKIANATITTAKIGNAQITTALIGDAQITTAKITDLAVSSAKIIDGAITNAKIANASIDTAKISTLDASVIKSGFIDAARIKIGANVSFDNGYDPTKISVGGRNYLRNTSKFTSMTYWGINLNTAVMGGSLSIVDDALFGKVLKASKTADGNSWWVLYNSGLTLPNGKFTIGKDYTVSFMMKNAFKLYVTFMNSNGTNSVTSTSKIPVNANWTKVEYTFTATATGDVPQLYIARDGDITLGDVYITQVKLEEGNKTTDYTVAIEDVDSSIATVQSGVDGVKTLTDGWKYGATTYIDGGDIYTNTITANQIAARTITANEIVAGTITANEIKANTITANQIATNTLTSNHISTSGLDASVIKTGTMNADLVTISNGKVTINSSGVTVTDADFLVKDKVTGYTSTVVQKHNMVKDHSFEMTEIKSGATLWNSYYFDVQKYYVGGGTADTDQDIVRKWAFYGSPKLMTTNGTDFNKDIMFGRQVMLVGYGNSVRQSIPVEPGQTYTISFHAKRPSNTALTTCVPVLDAYHDYANAMGQHIQNTSWQKLFTAPLSANAGAYERFVYTVTIPSTYPSVNNYLRISINGTNNGGWVEVDGVQVVKGSLAGPYNDSSDVYDLVRNPYFKDLDVNTLKAQSGIYFGQYGTRMTSYGNFVVEPDAPSTHVFRVQGSSGKNVIDAYVGSAYGDGYAYVRSAPKIVATLGNGWTHYNAAGGTFGQITYTKDASNYVVLDGLMRTGTGTLAFTLPAGYRPASAQIFNVRTASGTQRVDINNSGQVILGSVSDGGWTSLAGIRFLAEL